MRRLASLGSKPLRQAVRSDASGCSALALQWWCSGSSSINVSWNQSRALSAIGAPSARRLQEATWMQRRSRPWMCIKADCHTVNRTGATHCEVCNEAKPNLLGWGCVECGRRNHKGIKECKGCGAPASLAEGFWCCASCGKNNKVDLIDDNSRCGYCGYDMAPLTRSEAEVLQKAQERSEMLQMQQEYFDDLAKEGADGGDSDPGVLKQRPSNDRIWEAPAAAAEPAPPAAGGFDFEADVLDAIPAAPPVAPARVSYAEELDMPNYKAMRYDDDDGVADGDAMATGASASGPGGADAAGGGAAPKATYKPIPKPKLISQLASAETSKLPTRRPRLGSDTPMGPPGFEWMCRECGHRNPGETEGCIRCETLINPSEWVCLTCGAQNHRSRGKCFDCSTRIPVAWTCAACHNDTSIYDAQCRTCHAPRPEVPKIAREEMPMLGIGPRAPKAPSTGGPGGGGAGRKPAGDWFCLQCKTKNFGFRDRCFGCDQPRPGSMAVTGGAGGGGTNPRVWGSDDSGVPIERAVGENNWMCRFCRATNFRTRTECWQCKKPAAHLAGQRASATGGGGPLRTGSEPSFAKEGFQPGHENDTAPAAVNVWGKRGGGDGDWTCTKCFSKNYKNKKECFKCGAPKTSHLMPKIAPKKPVKI